MTRQEALHIEDFLPTNLYTSCHTDHPVAPGAVAVLGRSPSVVAPAAEHEQANMPGIFSPNYER